MERESCGAAGLIIDGRPLDAASISTVQVNIGLVCNLACHHCHVESSPARTEEMSWQTMELVLKAARSSGAATGSTRET